MSLFTIYNVLVHPHRVNVLGHPYIQYLCSPYTVYVTVHHTESESLFTTVNILVHPHSQCYCSLQSHSPCSLYMSLFTHIESMSLFIHIFNICVHHTQSESLFTTQSMSLFTTYSQCLCSPTVNVTVHHTESESLFTTYSQCPCSPTQLMSLFTTQNQCPCSPYTINIFVHHTQCPCSPHRVNVFVRHRMIILLFTTQSKLMFLFTRQNECP